MASGSELRRRLRDAGLRATAARVAVLRVLLRAELPMSHAEVCSEVDEFDRATVYRNLVDLADAGLLKRSDVGDHVWRFSVADGTGVHSSDPHAHFVCTRCGSVECLPATAVALRAVQGTPKSLSRQTVEVHVRGVCDTCTV